MGLRNFHLFFIAVSSLLCLFLMLWGLWNFKATGSYGSLALGFVGVVGLVLLLQYLKWFRKKKVLKELGAIAGLALSGALAWPTDAVACSVCYGDPNSSLSKGAILGVVFLLAVVVTVLTLIVFVARTWLRRAKALSIPL